MWIQSSSYVRRFVLIFTIMIPQVVFGWGRTGHLTIAEVGSKLARTPVPFWSANATNMVRLTDVPDMVWKSLPTASIEKPTHFFQPDSYYQDPSQFNLIPRSYSAAVNQFTKEFVDKSGTAVWRAQEFYDLAVAAIRSGDLTTAVEMAGVMSHYIGDMSQPLHDTSNYDGQATGQIGIHRFFETVNVQSVNPNQLLVAVGQEANALLHNPQFVSQFSGSMSDIVFNEVGRAYSYKDSLLRMDKEEGRHGQGAHDLLKLAIDRMADGGATLAIILTKMWQDAGNPNYGATVSVSVPDWVAPNYDGGTNPSFGYFSELND